MWKLKNKNRGFTIIEVMCSVTIFSIIFLTALSIKIATYKIKIYNDSVLKNIVFLESLKSEILSNLSDTELNELVNSNRVFINSENINENSLKDGKIADLFSNNKKPEMPYLKIAVDNGTFTHIKIEMYTKVIGKNKTLKCEFYKGKS